MDLNSDRCADRQEMSVATTPVPDSLEPLLPDTFPFVRHLDFTPVLEFWESLVRDKHGITADAAAAMRSRMESVSGLLGPIADLELVERNMEIVHQLMSVIIPPSFWDTSFIGAFVPFRYQAFMVTPRLMALMLLEQETAVDPFGLDSVVQEHKIALGAYLMIAGHFYGLQFDFQDPMITTVPDPVTGLRRHFRLDADDRFIRPVLIGDLPPLSDEQIRELRGNVTNIELWRRLIPDGSFEFHGVGLVSAVDVTDQEILSRLKHSLIDGDAGTTPERFLEVQQRVRELLRRPDILIVDDDFIHLLDFLTGESNSENEQMSGYAELRAASEQVGTIVDRALLTGRIQVTEDLAALEAPSAFEQTVLARGLRSLLSVPLVHDRKIVGTCNLASPHPFDLTVLAEFALREITPLFAMNLVRSREEMNNRTQAIIRERYTAIHPAIEWRFRAAANRMLYVEMRGSVPDAEAIVFDDVHTLYAVSDMRGSGRQRNVAIQADLTEQLRLALEVFAAAAALRPLPLLQNISFQISRTMARLESGISSGDESMILDFLRREIEPVFADLGGIGSTVTEQMIRYRAALDPDVGIVCRRRKEFEQSMATINATISAFLETEQVKIQAICPHYFEKHQTDGVDFGIYVGASMVENGKFELLHLKNLRLWQLMTVCGIARQSAALKSSLIVPLDTTHLILVQSAPLSIRFRLDEKRFDVDGGYNVRYEIIKKRIDKARIKGSTERLTQPETIAIVYSTPHEGSEYREYIEFMQSTGHLHAEVEQLDLEDLQEVQALKALRVRVRMEEE
jgi:hypothetical protein